MSVLSHEFPASYSPTAIRILDVAERLVAERGYNAVSYSDIAAELRMTKPSLHYHFAGKAELGVALVGRYHARFAEALAELDRTGAGSASKLDGYAGLYAEVLQAGRMCLCGILAAEYQTLPTSMQDAVLAFFTANEVWLEAVLSAGRKGGELTFVATPRDEARVIMSGLEGAMLVARPFRRHRSFSRYCRQLARDVTKVGMTGPTSSTSRNGIVVAAGEGRSYPMGRLSAVFKADGEESAGLYSISEWWLEPHTLRPGAHSHPEDDVFYVLDGTLTFLVADRCGGGVQVPWFSRRAASATTSRIGATSARASSTSPRPGTSSRTCRGSATGFSRTGRARSGRRPPGSGTTWIRQGASVVVRQRAKVTSESLGRGSGGGRPGGR